MNSVAIAWRNIRKNSGFSLLNLSGLIIGITSFLLLGAYIMHELSYDRFLPNADRIAYVSYAYKSAEDNEFVQAATTPTAVAPTLEKEFAEVARAVRLYPYNQEGLIKNGNQQIKETNFKFADEAFFEVADYPFIAGNSQHALTAPYQIVLTQASADKYFPSKDALGQVLEIDGQPWKVTGIVPTPPSYTQLPFAAILSNKHLTRYQEPVWHSANDITLLLLKDKHVIPALEAKANAYIKTIFADVFKNGGALKLKVEPITDVHLHSAIGKGNLLYVYIFMGLAIGIILITGVNFANLSLARSAERAKEIGVKKVLGASRAHLFFHFLIECSLLVLIAFAIAMCLAHILLPLFASYLGTTIVLAITSSNILLLAIPIFAISLAILAGSWPALVVSSFKPVQSLKGTTKANKGGFALGNVLIIIQFTVSTLFIIATLITAQQLHYIQTKNTGLDRSQIVVLDGELLSDAERTTLKSKLLARPAVNGFTASYDSPVNIQGGYNINYVEGKNADFQLSVTAIPIEKDFVPVFEIPVLAGANQSDSDIARARDTTDAREYSFIVNQQLVKSLQWSPEDAIGKQINLNGRLGRITTVVQDFNFASLREDIKPVVLFPEYSYFGNIYVKVASGSNMQQSISTIQSVWKEVKPQAPFDYHFLDDDFANLYQLERQTSRTMLLFSIVTIGIACLGLFALAAFQAQQRVKEIGIRKVLGASTGKIVLLLTSDFIKLVVIAFVLAVPIGYWIMKDWLQNFAFRIDLEYWTFLLAGIIAVLISLLTISGRAFRAARTNPIHSLRDE